MRLSTDQEVACATGVCEEHTYAFSHKVVITPATKRTTRTGTLNSLVTEELPEQRFVICIQCNHWVRGEVPGAVKCDCCINSHDQARKKKK